MSKPPIPQTPRNRSPSPAVGHNYGTTYLDSQDRTAKYRRNRPAPIIIRKSSSQSNISQQSPTRCESPRIGYVSPRRSSSQSGIHQRHSKRSPSPVMSPRSPTTRSPSPAMLPQSPRARSPSPALLSPRSSSPSVTQQVQRSRSSTPSLLEKLLRKTKESWGYDGGTSKLESSVKVLRSSSFLQKAREAQERERSRLGIQDDSIVQKQSSSSMKQRPRRIESFHGSRPRRYDKPPSVSSSTEGSIQPYHTPESRELREGATVHSYQTQESRELREGATVQSYKTQESRELREGATVQNENRDNQLPMEQATTPTTKQVKEWPTMADLSQKQILPNKYDSNQGYFNPHLSPSKSSPSLDKEEPHHPKTGSYTSPLINKSSPNIHDDVKKSTPSSTSSSSSSYSANQKWFSPNAYQKQSPRQYHSSSNFYQSSPQFTKHNPNDYQNLQDIQQSINQPNVMSYTLPPPVEKEESDPELQGLTKGDYRPLCSPPAPPTRDISSLKYVPLSNQSHAKYPSWPVTQPSADIESGEPINAPLSLLNEHNANQNNVRALKDRNSPNSERKASDRNASDPGFKKPIPFAVFLKRPDERHQQYGSHVKSDKKDTDSKMNDFFESLPGYQQPIFDQDGHRFGDEKYNVSPPERESDGRYPSQRVSNKTADNRYTPQYRGYQEPPNSSRIARDSGSNPLLSPDKDSKQPSFSDLRYSDKSLLHVTPDNKFTDSSTSPMQSPKDSKLPHGSKDNYPDNVQTSIYDPKNNSYLVKKTMVCYTTGTQTEFNSPKKKSPSSPGYNMHFPFDKSNQAIQTSPENTNKDDDFVHMRKRSRDKHEESYESRPRPKSTSEKDKILLKSINSELDSTDQHSAPFMRKLARDLLANQTQEHKRRSTSSSGGSGLRSPSSDYSHYFGELRESGSYSSVIIHDDLSEAESATSPKPDGTYDIEKQHLHQFEKLKSPRRSLDPSMFSQKFSSTRGLQNSRYGSEAQLVNQSHKDHTSSMINLPRSAREDSRPKFSRPSTDSSTPSHKTGSSTDTFSSTSTHYSYDASPGPYVPGIPGPAHHPARRESNDSVFVDEKSPFEKKGDNFKDFKSENNNDKKSKTTAWVGRTQSMKKAYGVYDETHSLIHKRQESEVSSSSSENHQFIHSRSQSDSNYLPMNEIRAKQNSDKMLGAINEETSEARWQDALRKSKSREISYEQNYSELDVKRHVNEKLREYQNKTELERTNLKRTSSEQFRPMKERMANNKTHSESKLDEPKQQLLPNKDLDMRQSKVTNPREKLSQSPSQSQTDLRSPSSSDSSRRSSDRLPSPSSSRLDLRSDSNSGSDKKSPSPSSSRADLVGSRDDLKRAQKNALQNFMLTKTGRLPSDEEENLQQLQNNGNVQSQPDRPTRLSVTESFRKKYAEGDKLRRSRSISSTDSGNYTEMRPPMRPQPTEWSRVRSQTARRPQSIGSDSGSSLVDPYAVTPVISSSFDHQRSDSLESPRVEQMTKDLQSSGDTTPQRHSRHSIRPRKHVPIIIQSPRYSGPRMGSSNIYQNLMPEHPGYRKPPPPPPPSEEDKPPELPPRNYRQNISQSDSQLRQQRYNLPPAEESHEQYAEQLRKFSRRYSEQQSAASMVYLSSKTQTHITQSFPKPEVKSLEATSPITSHSPPSSISAESPKMSTSQFVPQQQQPSYSASFTQPTSQTKNVSPSSSHHQSPSSSSFDISNEKLNDSRHLQPSPRQSPPMSRNRQPSPQQHSPPPSVLRQISSPDPPPPPTPMKEGEEFNQELPPPPPEILDSSETKPDGFSDDSYLAHKSKGDTRQIGTYKRSSTTGDVTKLPSETNNNKVEIQKPPRKRLLQQAWQPQTSQSNISEQSNEQSSVPRFSASESLVNPNVVKSVAKPLEKNHIQQRPLGSSYSASALLTPRPFSSTTGTSQKETLSHSADREERTTSVRDQILGYEKKATPRRPDRFNSPKLIPRSPSNINSSRSHVDPTNESNGIDPTRRPSNENVQQSELQNNLSNSVHEGSSRLSLDNDPSKYSSPRRTSFPPEKHKVNFIGRYGNDGDQERKNLSHSDLNGDVKLPLRSQDNHLSESFILQNNSGDKGHSYRHSNRSSDHDTHNVNKSHKSFTPNHEQHPSERKGLVEKGHNSARDQELQVCHGRQRSQEELECDKKVSEIVKKDESLKEVLKVDNKGRMDFMNGLFPLDEPVRLPHSPHHSPQSSSVNEEKNDRRMEEQKSPLDTSALPADYFKSSPKAKIEMDMRGKSDEFNQEMSKEIGDPDTLIKTKEELVRSIQKKVEKLKEEKSELQKETDEIDEVGQKLVEVVQQKGRTQQEKDKFSSYITDMEKIIKLLLKLSGLLARAENALQSLPDNSSPSIKKLAVDKRDRLRDQHEEAKSLKEDIDKRSAQVSIFLQDCLTDAEYEDYKYFVQMKSKLTIEMQEFEDKITLGQEQILGLKRNIPDK